MPHQIRETAVITEAAAADAAASGRLLVQLISPGWGSSGYYSTAVLEQAAADAVIPSGTHMYADHPTDTEVMERPERSIRDLMAVTTETARIATADDVARGADTGSLVAEVRVAAPYRDLIDSLVEDIGVSIRGSASDITMGEAEGRTGRIIEGLAHVASVDFVTRAGRGGRVLQLVESARAARRATERGLSEATVNDTRDALQTALTDAYGGDRVYVWIRDFDDSTVWFEVEGDGDRGLFAQPYTQSDGGAVALTGDRTEVRVVTTYVPATRPDGNTTEESEEDTMPNIEESELARLREADGRVTTLESERDAAVQRAETAEAERDQARGELAERDRTATISRIVDEASTAARVELNEFEAAGLAARAVRNADGAIDEAATRTAFDTAIASIKESRGSVIHGFGRTTQPTPDVVSESDLDALDDAVFGTISQEA